MGICLCQTGLWADLWSIFLINNPCGRAQPALGGTTPVRWLGCSRKADQAIESKGVISTLDGFCFSSCLQVPALLELLTLSDGLGHGNAS